MVTNAVAPLTQIFLPELPVMTSIPRIAGMILTGAVGRKVAGPEGFHEGTCFKRVFLL
jgi:hypothetical protein